LVYAILLPLLFLLTLFEQWGRKFLAFLDGAEKDHRRPIMGNNINSATAFVDKLRTP